MPIFGASLVSQCGRVHVPKLQSNQCTPIPHSTHTACSQPEFGAASYSSDGISHTPNHEHLHRRNKSALWRLCRSAKTIEEEVFRASTENHVAITDYEVFLTKSSPATDARSKGVCAQVCEEVVRVFPKARTYDAPLHQTCTHTQCSHKMNRLVSSVFSDFY